MVWRIEETALFANPLHERQYAFQRNISTENAISDSINDIEKDLYRENMVITRVHLITFVQRPYLGQWKTKELNLR